MIMACPDWTLGRGEILRKAENRSFEAMMNTPKDVARITKWIQKEGNPRVHESACESAQEGAVGLLGEGGRKRMTLVSIH